MAIKCIDKKLLVGLGAKVRMRISQKNSEYLLPPLLVPSKAKLYTLCSKTKPTKNTSTFPLGKQDEVSLICLTTHGTDFICDIDIWSVYFINVFQISKTRIIQFLLDTTSWLSLVGHRFYSDLYPDLWICIISKKSYLLVSRPEWVWSDYF